MTEEGAVFKVGRCVRGLREERAPYSLEEAAGDAGLSSTDRLWRMELRSDNLDRWLSDLDAVARLYGLTLAQLVERARVAT